MNRRFEGRRYFPPEPDDLVGVDDEPMWLLLLVWGGLVLFVLVLVYVVAPAVGAA